MFGERTRLLQQTLADAVHAAQEKPQDQVLPVIYQDLLADYRRDCEVLCASATQTKAHALAREMLYDWDVAIRFWVHPQLPLTNNEPERALRHRVLRGICHGALTEDGTRIVATLMSVIETCHLRQ